MVGRLCRCLGVGELHVPDRDPLEFAKGYGCISMANASLLPTLQINLAASSSVYSTAPTTVPTLEIDNYSEFYWLPQQQIEPPGLGSTRQFVLQVANPTIGSTSSQQVTFPRLVGYIDMFILVLRDSTNARIDVWPTEIRLYVDGIPLIQIRTDMLYDDMANQYQYNPYTAGTARETGVIVLTRKTSLGQLVMGLLDSLETTLSTNPGTSLAVEGMPWGTVSNALQPCRSSPGRSCPAVGCSRACPRFDRRSIDDDCRSRTGRGGRGRARPARGSTPAACAGTGGRGAREHGMDGASLLEVWLPSRCRHRGRDHRSDRRQREADGRAPQGRRGGHPGRLKSGSVPTTTFTPATPGAPVPPVTVATAVPAVGNT